MKRRPTAAQQYGEALVKLIALRGLQPLGWRIADGKLMEPMSVWWLAMSQKRRAEAWDFGNWLREGVELRDRTQEKALSRARDEADLKSGRITAEELRERNNAFAGLRVKLDLEYAKKAR